MNNEQLEHVFGEKWKPIQGFEEYLISESGQVFSTVKNIIMKQFETRGYKRVALRVKYKFTIHRLVCSAFNGGELKSKLSVDHIDMNIKNNHYSNLRWMTCSENARIGQVNRKYKHKGIVLEKGRYRARLYVNRKPFHIGVYDNFDEAMFNYRLNYKEWFGHYPNSGDSDERTI